MVLLVSAHSAEILLSSTHVPVYFLHPFKLRFFIAKCIQCQCTIYISVYLPAADLQKPHENLRSYKMHRSWLFSKNYHCECGHLPGWNSCFQIKSRTSQQTWNGLRALKLCAIYPQSCMEFLTILGTTALMASS